jgi:hypothetical protein
MIAQLVALRNFSVQTVPVEAVSIRHTHALQRSFSPACCGWGERGGAAGLILAQRGRASATGKWVAIGAREATSPDAAPKPQSVSIDRSLPPAGRWDKAVSQRHGGETCTRSSGELGAAISRRVGGSDCSVAKFGDEGRCVGGEAARIRGEAARRSAVGGRGDKPIGMVPKAEVDRLSVSPQCAFRGSEARQGSTRPLYAARVDRRARSANSLCEEPSVRRCCSSWNLI